VHAEVVKGSDWVEALFFLEPHRALIAGDLLIGKAGGGIELPVGWFPKVEQDWAEQELKPELRKRLAELPVELVVVSHGEPVLEDGAAALERALA
jgi:glyoxylase-like metal-dependent hydrolase (beta-lactamase superfamily II)